MIDDRSFMIGNDLTAIVVLAQPVVRWHICGEPFAMSTIGKRYAQRTGDQSITKVLDHRTRSLLNAVLREQRGKALDAYLMARPGKAFSRPC
ncbi:MAG: hypothetical protein IPG69_02420 [Flavobacteriales bacterium]|jgi:hypothetical protein|nr:hypothetical protein [Flavobacteriales bacterium]MBK7752102.1 hypothetical protein [Flavobacteriales bacterium]MBK9074422.1 hypothetical protein [Flavobacteriales bacterium]MBK9537957.1 hypothetical protein [Flavobacteriales bacterium]